MLTSAVPAMSRSAALDLLPTPASDDNWLPPIAAGDVAALNALYRHRRSIETSVARHRIAIETCARVTVEPDAYAFRLVLLNRQALLRVSANLVDLCAQSLAVTCFDRLGAQQAGMMLELALLHLIRTLETRLRTGIRIEERIETIKDVQTFVPLQFRVSGVPGNGAIELFIDPQNTTAIAAALDEFADPNSRTEQLPILVQVCAAGTDLTLSELRTLRPGDVILPDHDPKPSSATVAVVGERVQFQTERVASGVRIVSRLSGARADSTGVGFMQQPTEALQRPALDEADLEQLPIRLVFEVGRLEIPLAEVRRLAAGYVLPLARPTDAAVDIVANGRKIGRGSLLKIGDSIGVRVERLLSDD